MKILRLSVVGWLFGMVLCNLAYAQSLAGCRGISQTTGPKVVLDKLEYKSEAGVTQVLTSEYETDLVFELVSRLKNLFPDTQPKPVLCPSRAPKPDGSDFIPDMVTTLNNRDVLLELWGTIIACKKDGKPAIRANILMIIIPVRYYNGGTSQPDFHILSYPKTERTELKDDMMKLAFGTEFCVYTLIAHGIKELKNDSYDKARKYFSSARTDWEEAMKNGSLANTPSDQQRLLEYIKRLEERTISDAQADPNYKGDLVAVTDVLAERGP